MSVLSKFGIAFGVLLLVIAGLAVLLSGVSPSIQPRRNPAPEGFDAANFPPYLTLRETEDFTVVHLDENGDAFHPELIPDLGVTYITIATGNYTSYFLFLNDKGDEIGRIEKTRVTFPMGETFVDIAGYYTVSRDGVSPLQPYDDVNNNAPIALPTLKELHARATLHRGMRPYDLADDRPEKQQNLNTHVMLIDGRWTRATTTAEDFLNWKTAPFPKFHTQYKFSPKNQTSPNPETYGDSNFFGGKYSVHQVWFDQQEYFRRRAAPMGSTTGVGRPEHWRGVGYYELNAGDKSIGFSIPNDVQILSGGGRVTLGAMGHETLDFMLLEHYVRNTPKYLLIRAKD